MATATTQVLPREVRLNPPPTVPQARSYLFKQQSTNNTYTPGSSTPIQINIPRLQRSYLSKDSFLKFRLTTAPKTGYQTVGAELRFDKCGAFGLFDKIEVFDYLGSTLLESTSMANVLTTLLLNTSTSAEEMKYRYSSSCGTSSLAGAGQIVGQWTNIAGSSIATATAKCITEFSIPLLSFLGLLSPKFAPLHNGFTIMLTLADPTNAFIGVTGSSTTDSTLDNTNDLANSSVGIGEMYNITVDNMYFEAQILELGPVAESMLLSSTQGAPLIVSSKAYKYFTNTIDKGVSNFRMDLNLNVASMTNVLWVQRPSACNKAITKNLSTFVRNYLSSWYFQYGSSILPQTTGILAQGPYGSNVKAYVKTPSVVFGKDAEVGQYIQVPGGSTECYLELMKSRHSLNSYNLFSQIDLLSYNQDIGNTYQVPYVVNRTNANYDNITPQPSTTNVQNTYYTLNILRTTNVDLVSAYGFQPWIVDNYLNTSSTFACGLDLELVSGKSGDLVCGMNTNGMNTSLFMTFDTTQATAGQIGGDYTTAAGTPWVYAKTYDGAGTVQSCRVDCWCEYDSFVNVSPGIATTVSF